ncbi:MAG: C25 family cysteine peptidase [Actinomycetota bacterium]|nr:C25 family cysteine peptidase [Actinomycetota bacterium]
MAIIAGAVAWSVSTPLREASAAGETITATFYVPLFEDNAFLALDAVDAGTTNSIGTQLSSTVSITVTAPNTIIYYDHWESGSNGNTAPTYDPIPNAPSGSSTVVFGDGNTGNGNAATYCEPAPCATGDVLNVGDVLRLNNSNPSNIVPGPLTNPRAAGTVVFDGRDRISSTDPLAVTHATWPTTVNALHSEMAAAFDTSRWGVNFVAPVGINTVNQGSGVSNFSYAGMEVMAQAANTVVSIDANNDGDYLDGVDVNGVTIGEGQFVYAPNISQGAKAVTSKPAQVFMMTGRVGSNYEDRSYQVFPTEGLVNDYTVPASTARNDGSNEYATVLYIHNPQATAITVNVQTSAGTNSYNIAAGTTFPGSPSGSAPWLLTGQTARLTSTSTFAVFAASGTRQQATGGNGNISQDYDWGFSPVPARLMLDSVYVGWAPGSQDLTAPDNDVVWVTTTTATTIYVDLDGDATTGPFTDPQGGRYDLSYPVAALNQLKVTDTVDNDMTGAHIYTVDGVGIATAYGEDPKAGNEKGTPGIDLGTTMFPPCGAMCVRKTVELAIDLDGDGHVDPGDTLQWSIRASDTDYHNLLDPVLIDDLQTGLSYVPGSSTFTVNAGSPTPVADDAVPSAITLFPFDESGRLIGYDNDDILIGGAVTIRYQTTVNLDYSGSGTICNRAIVLATRADLNSPANGASTACIPIDGLRLTKTSNSGGNPVVPGQALSYSIVVSNTTTSTISNIAVTDLLPAGLNWVSTSVTRPANTGTTVSTYTDTFETVDTWLGSASATAWTDAAWTDSQDGDWDNGSIRKRTDVGDLSARISYTAVLNAALTRTVGDLSAATAVTFAFEYRCESLEAGDEVQAQVRPTTGGTWVAVATYNNCNAAGYTAASFNLTSGQWGASTQVRFIVSNAFDNTGDRFFVDNVVVSASMPGPPRVTSTVPGAAPPNLVTLTDLLAGESATIVINTTVTDPFTGPDELTNYAMARSGNQVAAAEVTDCVRCFDYGDAPASYEGPGGTDPARAAKQSLRSTFGDTFQTGGFAGSTGSTAWNASSWTEVDAGGIGATTGYLQNAADGGERSARFGNGTTAAANTALTRQVGDLTGYSSAMINVTYRCESLEADDVVYMQVSPNGSAPWTTLQTFTSCNGVTYSNQITELPIGTLGAATTVRFIVNNALDAGDYLFINDVQITATAHDDLPGPRLGTNSDREASGVGGAAPVPATAPAAPLGDDSAGGDDEDGVALPAVNTETLQIPITISDATGGPSYVNGWFDWNNDGDFDPEESLFDPLYYVSSTGGLTVVNGVGQAPAPGTYTVTVTVPALDQNGSGYQIGDTVYSRFRVATLLSEVQAPTGESSDGEVEDYNTTLNTLPVNLSYFASQRSGGSVALDWRTAQEVDNLGFNIYGEAADGSLVQLNDELVVSKAPTSMTPQDYELVVSTTATVLWLEDIALDGTPEQHGPYAVGEAYGDPEQPEQIDWAANRAEVDAALAPQQQSARTLSLRQTGERRGGQPTVSGPVAQLSVTEPGVQVVTYEQLLAAGVNLNGVNATKIAVTDPQGPVAIEVVGPAAFGPGSLLRFIGEPLDTLYTGTNSYWVHVDKTLARRVAAGPAVGAATSPVATHSATVTRDDNHDYSVTAPGSDPWYDQVLVAFPGAPGTASTSIDLADVVADQPATVAVELWGISYTPIPDEHHVQLSVNGQQVAEGVFDGTGSIVLQGAIPAGLLQSGANSLTLTTLAVDGIFVDFTAVNTWSVTYQRSAAAIGGRLDLTATGDRIDVTGLDPTGALAYRVATDGTVTALPATLDGATLQVAGAATQARYVFSAAGAVRSPAVAPLPVASNLLSGKADYVMITNGALVDGLAPLVAYHKSRGLKVKVIDVADIYRAYSHGVVDAAAIDAYLAVAIPKLKLRWVLLVGADSVDYRDYLGIGSFSLLPSPYGSTGSSITYAPLDPAYADWDADGIPDVALGRMPARTPDELATMISKTLEYANSVPQRSAVLASDANDGIDYAGFNDGVEAELSGWSVRRADIDRQGVEGARTELLDAVIDGVGMVFYLGHSSSYEWTESGLFGTADVPALAAAARPTAVAQFGCWNTYYVSPYADTLGHTLMLTPTGGAAVVMGAATLTSAAGDLSLAQFLSQQLAGGQVTVGEAVMAAKQSVRQGASGSVTDIELGWTILGDPALPVGGGA